MTPSTLARLQKHWRRTGIQVRLAMLVLLVSGPFIAFVAASTFHQVAEESAHVREQSLALARLVAARLDDQIGDVDAFTATVSHMVSANVYDRDRNDALLKTLRPDLPSSIINMAVWDLAGNNIGTLDASAREHLVNIADRDYFRQAIAHNARAVEAPIVSRGTGEVVAQIARPVHGPSGAIVGVVSASVRLRDLQKLLDPQGTLAAGTLVSIVDPRGFIISRSIDPEKWIGKYVSPVSGVQQSFREREGSREQRSIDGVQRLAGFSTSHQVDWLVYVGIPLEVATASVYRHFYATLGAGLVSLIIAFLMSAWMGRRMTQPVRQLARDAGHFGAGNLGYRSGVTDGAEFAQLAKSMNSMAASLEERSNALERSEAWLKTLTDTVPTMIAYVDRHYRYQFANHYYLDVLGLEPQNMVGRQVPDVIGAEWFEKVAPSLLRAMEGMPIKFEYELNMNGRSLYLVATYLPDYGPRGDVRGIFVLNQDISEQKRAAQRLAESKQRLRTITDNLPALICYIDHDRRYAFNNKAYADWLGRPVEQLTGRCVRDVVPSRMHPGIAGYVDRVLGGERVQYDAEVPDWTHGAHRSRWVRGVYIPDVDESGRVVGAYGMTYDITAEKKAELALIRMAQYDGLTELPNRRQFDTRLASALEQTRQPFRPLAVLFLDIDHFKRVNDTYGHAAGDTVLKEFAQRLRNSVRACDFVARLAGDEFVAILEGVRTSEEVRLVADKLLRACRNPVWLGEVRLTITCSIGVSLSRSANCSASALLREADDALYAAKSAGRNAVLLSATVADADA